MLEDGVDLPTGDAGEPAEKVVHPGTRFKVLKECLDRHTRALEDPGAAHLAREPFDRAAPGRWYAR